MVNEIGDVRSKRKVEHVEAVRTLGDDVRQTNWFEHVTLIPNCAPELAVDDISLRTSVCGLSIPSPIVINAMTGGAEETYEVNRRLASLAKRYGLAMALGSGTAAIKNPALTHTYRVVRDVHRDGVVFANVGMGTDVETAKAVIDMVDAQVLQVHWNVAQELFMAEGDRNFRGAMEQFQAIVASVGVPVIAKEVGQGIAAEEAKRFVDAGAHAIDVGGRGGTNFIAVEAWRRGFSMTDEWALWGLPTAATLCEVVDAVGEEIDVLSSGGIRTAGDIVKSLALGARAVGIAGPLLRLVSEADWESKAVAYMEELHWGIQTLMALSGCKTIAELQRRPVVLSGPLREWLDVRHSSGTVYQRMNHHQM